MKKDISFPPVQGVVVAVVQKDNPENGAKEWYVYLINENDYTLENVMVTSRGYGKKGDEEQKTSILRHVVGNVEANEYALIELIDPSVFHLTNEYWVSYFVNNQVYDKKFIFVPETLIEDNLMPVHRLQLRGVVHK